MSRRIRLDCGFALLRARRSTDRFRDALTGPYMLLPSILELLIHLGRTWRGYGRLACDLDVVFDTSNLHYLGAIFEELFEGAGSYVRVRGR